MKAFAIIRITFACWQPLPFFAGRKKYQRLIERRSMTRYNDIVFGDQSAYVEPKKKRSTVMYQLSSTSAKKFQQYQQPLQAMCLQALAKTLVTPAFFQLSGLRLFSTILYQKVLKT